MTSPKLRSIFALAAALSVPAHLPAATFGNVVTTIGGHPADIALDESRGRLYIANFTAMEIDVMTIADRRVAQWKSLTSHPSGLALSPDGTYLVVTEYQNGVSTPQGFDGVMILNLKTNAQQTFTTGDPALGVAFVNAGTSSGQALIGTTKGFYLLDPVSGTLQSLVSYGNLAQTLPTKQPKSPSQLLQMQMTATADGKYVWGIGSAGASSDTQAQLIFRYSSAASSGFGTNPNSFIAQGWVTTPPLLPRVSAGADGSWAMIGWTKFALAQCGGGFMVQNRYPQAVASTTVTGHAVTARNGSTDTIYGQIFDVNQPSGPPYAKAPTLSIMDSDNLTVRDRLNLPENLVGRALLDKAGNNMYAISDSGVTVLPVGSLNRYPRISSSNEDVLIQTNFCNRTPLRSTFTLSDPGGNATDFSISSSQNGVLVSPSSGRTPATITVTVQPGAIPNPGGTLAVPLKIFSSSAVNAAPAVRLLISNPDQDQRGSIVNIPGKLVDVLADAGGRNRFYVLRQDKNQVLVFDGSNYKQLAVLRTNTTPTGMSFTPDRTGLIVASTDSQLLTVFDLDTFQPRMPVQLPPSHYGRSVAQSNADTFAVIENDGAPDCLPNVQCAIDQLDLASGCAFSPPALGVFTNDAAAIPDTSVLAPSSDQNSILLAAPNGNVMLYSVNAASAPTWILSRQDLKALSGAYAVADAAAGASGGPSFPTRYVIGDNVFDAALVPQGTLDVSVGSTAGFAFMGSGGYRATGSTASAAGVIQNLPDVLQARNVRPVRTTEAPMLSSTDQPFTRTVAPLPTSIALLTTSGITVLAPNYDAAVAPPSISSVTSAADGSAQVAPGGLITVYGAQMSPTNMATSQMPLPTALAGSCLSVNGTPVPLLFVSGGQINAQLPYNVSGAANLMVHTPGGISDNYQFAVSDTAPSVFRSGSAGPNGGLATIVRADNGELVTPTNPIHTNDTIVIYATGLGRTAPAVDTGIAAPDDQLAVAVIPPTVTLGGKDLNVFYAGLVPGWVGLYQINATVPFGVPQGLDIPLVINQGGNSTTLSVRVVK